MRSHCIGYKMWACTGSIGGQHVTFDSLSSVRPTSSKRNGTKETRGDEKSPSNSTVANSNSTGVSGPGSLGLTYITYALSYVYVPPTLQTPTSPFHKDEVSISIFVAHGSLLYLRRFNVSKQNFKM